MILKLSSIFTFCNTCTCADVCNIKFVDEKLRFNYLFFSLYCPIMFYTPLIESLFFLFLGMDAGKVHLIKTSS